MYEPVVNLDLKLEVWSTKYISKVDFVKVGESSQSRESGNFPNATYLHSTDDASQFYLDVISCNPYLSFISLSVFKCFLFQM